MDTVWIQMTLGIAGSVVLGVVTNLITPTAGQFFRRIGRRVKRRMTNAVRHSGGGLAGRLGRLVRPARRLARFVLR